MKDLRLRSPEVTAVIEMRTADGGRRWRGIIKEWENGNEKENVVGMMR